MYIHIYALLSVHAQFYATITAEKKEVQHQIAFAHNSTVAQMRNMSCAYGVCVATTMRAEAI